jgi:hypothetical protein
VLGTAVNDLETTLKRTVAHREVRSKDKMPPQRQRSGPFARLLELYDILSGKTLTTIVKGKGRAPRRRTTDPESDQDIPMEVSGPMVDSLSHGVDRVMTFNTDRINEFSLELHEFDLKPPLAIEPFRKLLLKITTLVLKPWASFLADIENQTWQKQNADAQQNPGVLRSDMGEVQVTGDSATPIGRRQRIFVDVISRIVFAFVGGAALLVPMIIMNFKTSRTGRLITVSVATLLFGIVLSLSTRANYQEVIGATAAYAAVMVVYVGSATP